MLVAWVETYKEIEGKWPDDILAMNWFRSWKSTEEAVRQSILELRRGSEVGETNYLGLKGKGQKDGE